MYTKEIIKSSVIFKSLVAACDQATLSVLSFVISIILIKNVPKVEYGYYSIGVAVTFFVLSIQRAIVNTPLAILLIEKKGQEKDNYAGSLCYGQFLVILPVLCIGFATIIVLYFWRLNFVQTCIAASVCFAVVGILFREFLRSYLFAQERPLHALKIDLIYILLLSILIPLAYFLYKISVTNIFLVMGISGLAVGSFFGFAQSWRYKPECIKESYRENWKFGKWALFGGMVTYLQSYSYLYLLGALLGSVAVAEVSAARLFIMPMILFRAGWGNIVIPHGSKLRENCRLERFFKEQALVTIIYVLVVVLYAVLILGFSDFLQKLMLTQKYVDSFKYFPYWATVNAIGFIGMNAAFGLEVVKMFKIMSKINFITMLVTLGCAYLLISTYGIIGGLMALIIGASFSAVILWYYFVKSVFSDKSINLSLRPNQILRATPLGRGPKKIS